MRSLRGFRVRQDQSTQDTNYITLSNYSYWLLDFLLVLQLLYIRYYCHA